MLIGLLSDSHADTSRLENAVAILARQGAEAVVHCGDIEAVEHVEILAQSGVPAYLVAGNMDRHPAKLSKLAEDCGVNFAPDFLEVPLGDDQYLIALHGHNEQLLMELVQGGQFPYICHGHTHRTADNSYGPVRVICPGALSNPRSPKFPTVVILDTNANTLRFLEVS
ncbi:MAG: YfcE family phosphodiesterase [bacterium]|nr:YfcE family phosphodiesterase [bacterium]